MQAPSDSFSICRPAVSSCMWLCLRYVASGLGACLQGVIESRMLEDAAQQKYTLALIARRSRLHPGMRYIARGLNSLSSPGMPLLPVSSGCAASQRTPLPCCATAKYTTLSRTGTAVLLAPVPAGPRSERWPPHAPWSLSRAQRGLQSPFNPPHAATRFPLQATRSRQNRLCGHTPRRRTPLCAGAAMCFAAAPCPSGGA